jgi:hypothetical protein
MSTDDPLMQRILIANDVLTKENEALKVKVETLTRELDELKASVATGTTAVTTIKVPSGTNDEDGEAPSSANIDVKEEPVEGQKIDHNGIEDIETGIAQPQGDVEEEAATTIGAAEDGASYCRPVIKSDKDLDREELMSLANVIKNEPQDYSEEEKEAIREGKEFYMKCKASKKF